MLTCCARLLTFFFGFFFIVLSFHFTTLLSAVEGGTFGSALHMGCVGVSWYFVLTAQPHFTGEHTIHHIHGPNAQGLKDLIRNFVQGGGCN